MSITNSTAMIHYRISKKIKMNTSKINVFSINMIHVLKKKLNVFIILESKFHKNYFL